MQWSRIIAVNQTINFYWSPGNAHKDVTVHSVWLMSIAEQRDSDEVSQTNILEHWVF